MARLFAFLCALSALPVLLSAASSMSGEWHRLEMPDCSILSDCKQKDIEAFAVTYAAYREAVKKILVGPEVKLPRSEIVLFRRQDDFDAHVPPPRAENFVMKAYSIEVDRTAVTALSAASDRREAMSSLIEFETIWMLRRLKIWVPIWASQGAGQVLSTLYVDKKGFYEIGAKAERFTGTLVWNRYFAWDRFFSVYNDSPEYKGEKDPGVYHAQAWALMHWVLLGSPGGQERFQELNRQLRTQLAVPALTQVMGVGGGDFTAVIKKHVNAGEVLKRPFDEKALREKWQLLSVPEQEVRARLFDMLTAAGKTAAAWAEMARLMQLAPDSIPVLEARARQALRDEDPETAATLYRRAMEAGSTNPQAYLVSARVRLNRSSVGNVDHAGGGGNNVPQALADIQQALTLAPDSADAYELMGRAFYLSPQLTEENIAALAPGIGPGRSQVQFYRALLYERLQHFDEALADVRAVVADSECPLARRRSYESRIPQMLFNKDRAATEALVKTGGFAAARALLAKVRTENPDAADNYDKLEHWVSSREGAATYGKLKPQVEALVKKHSYAEAKALLAAQRADAESEEVRKLCDRLQAWVEEGETVNQLRGLYRAKDWAGFREQLRQFADKYPKSRALDEFRVMDKKAEKALEAAKS